MTALQKFDLDLSWLDDEDTMASLEIMLRNHMSPANCAKILKIDMTSLAFALQTNPHLKKILGQSLDAGRYTLAKKAVNQSETVLDKMVEIATGLAANGSDTPSYKEMTAAAKIVFDVAGATGNRAAVSEQRLQGEQEQNAKNELLEAFAKALAGQLQLK